MTENKQVKNIVKKAKEVVFSCQDNRIFGAMIPVSGDFIKQTKKGKNKDLSGFPADFIGPVQILPTNTLHNIQIDETQITSHFRDLKGKGGGGGNLGWKYTVRYALYCGTGIYNPYRGKSCQTTSKDLADLDEAMVHASSTFRTSTKTWCQPILYLRVMYKKETGNGFRDLPRLIDVSVKQKVPSKPEDIELNLDALIKYLTNDKIHKCKGYVAKYAKELYPDLAKVKCEPTNKFADDDKDYCSEYLWLYEVRHSNINGDPNYDNRPRVYENTEIGYATPERIKRWVRDYQEMKGNTIFISRNIPRQSAAQRLLQMVEEEDNQSN